MIWAAATLTIVFGSIPVILWVIWPLLPAGPGRHIGRERINCGGRLVPDQPRQGKQPWKTAAQPVLPPEPAPEQDRYPAEEFLDLPVVPGFMRQRGDWGTMPAERIIAAEGERLASVMRP